MHGKLIVVGLLAAAGVQSAFARDVELRRSVKVGAETPIIAHSLFRGECETKSPDIKILQQPQNGTAVVKTGKRTFPKGGKGNMAKCDGKTGTGSAVHYTPKKDFQGFDTFQYEVDTNSGKNKVTVRIRVGTPPQLKNEGWVKPQ
ncbi:MAG: hypothetical protein FJX29_06745 [Alphaproteobacteria bacterium]|nr:hypothetical protein [Alphaproteobacteria bacterium]